LALALALAVPTLVADRPVGAGEVTIHGTRFTVPEGFTLELVASSPLVDRPITAAFDDRGRLYVADSSGTNDPVRKQLEDKPHRVVRLEDTNGDGRFDRSVVFADRMMFPEGTMWLDGSLYVAAPPQIWKLTDTDGDGVADRREVWFDGQTLTGCANDLHGPYPGPDGWIYWAKGAFAEQTYERPGKPPFKTRAAHIFRAKPDGSAIEPVMTGGMDNPVDVVFTPGGERLFNGTFFVHPGGGLRDGIIHAIYGGVYGKTHDPIYEPIHKWTSPNVMPILVHLGPAAPAGLHRYESLSFGPDYRDNVFCACFNLHKVTRHVLKPSGATFATEDADFVVAPDNLDFHPTDVIEDADGSLLIVDTGGWYKLCCPTSQLHKPDVLGAIYRVRKVDAPKVDDPWGLDVRRKVGDLRSPRSGDEIVRLLADPRPAVRRYAIKTLASPGRQPGVIRDVLLPELRKFATPEQPVELRRNVVWTLTRIDLPEARAEARRLLDDPDETVRQAALHAIALWRDRDAVPSLIPILQSSWAHNRRAAAEALGRIGDKTAVAALLNAVADATDRVLEHSLIYAIIEIGDLQAVRDALTAAGADEKTRRAALIALDQIDGGALAPDLIARELEATDPATKEVASWIVGRHPEWGPALAGYLKAKLDAPNLAVAERSELERQLARFARAREIQDLLAHRAVHGSATARRSALKAMAQAAPAVPPPGWIDALTDALADGDATIVAQAIAAARALPASKDKTKLAELANALLAVGRDARGPAAMRLEALAAAPEGPGLVDSNLFTFLLTQLSTDLPVTTRAAASEVLGKARLTTEQLLALADALPRVGPLEVGRLLSAFEGASDDAVGRRLVAALLEAPALSALRIDQIRPRLAKFSDEVRRSAEAIDARLAIDIAAQRAKLDELLALVPSGDIRRGQSVFHSAKAACITCHQMGYVGGKVGPDLTRIGQVRAERDLLEAIVYPSASFVRSYEPVTIATTDGRVLNGILKKDAPDEIVLAVSATEEARVSRGDIDELRPGTVSVMPAGLDQQLTPQELADLVVFLKASNR
jgi:putative membrane-bound dehydrogenase-like protein